MSKPTITDPKYIVFNNWQGVLALLHIVSAVVFLGKFFKFMSLSAPSTHSSSPHRVCVQ